MNVVSLDSYRPQPSNRCATCTRTVTHWDDEDDDCLDLEDDEPWWRHHAWLPLMACWLLALAAFTPTVRLACWAILWVAYLVGTEPAPPATYTPWAPQP